jgi:Putative auto-transporter adhesin, head GIN domain
MKKLIFALSAIVLALGSFAQDGTEKKVVIKKIQFKEATTSLVVNDGISIVLMDEPGAEIIIEGISATVESVEVTGSRGEIIVSSRLSASRKPVVVYVPANFIKKITINGASLIGSYQVLPIQDLDVIINGDCDLVIRISGKLNISSKEDFSVVSQTRSITN